MNMETNFSLLRDKLDALGFHQPLPIGSLPIVSALLNDLAVTTKHFKDAKTQINQLNKEKAAWELGVEPYKCDNSKLLAECNQLHVELMKQRDAFDAQINVFKKTIRDLRSDKQYLEEQCTELRSSMAMFDDPRYEKNRTNKSLQNRKPFISTVRSGDFPMPPPLPVHSTKNEDHAKCSRSTPKECHCLATEYERNNVQNQLELIELYNKQLERRNNEITRLNRLLIGGRPVTALAKDCCYDGVGTLTQDIDAMQLEMSELKQRLDEALHNQHDTEQRASALKRANEAMAREMRELKEVALGVESDANSTVDTLRQQNAQLNAKIYEAKKAACELESKLEKMKKRYEMANAQVRSLQTIVDRTCGREKDMKSMASELSKQIKELKLVRENAAKAVVNVGTMTQPPSSVDTNTWSIDVNRLKADREFYQREYLKLKSRQFDDIERRKDVHCRCQSIPEHLCACTEPSQRCECTSNAYNHLKSKSCCDHERQQQIEQLKETIRQLETENRTLHASQGPNKTMVNLLKEELNQLREQIDELTAENSRLQTQHNQLKLLQKRTESNLIDHETQLKHHSKQLSNAESQLTLNETCRREVCHEIRDSKAEIARLNTTNECLQKEKDRLIMKLDAKTEKICLLEKKLESFHTRLAEMNCQTDTATQQLESATSERRKNQDSVRKLSTENERLRAQIDQMRRINENAMAECSRLTNELVDSECLSVLHKTKLAEADKQVEQLKNQLQQYVQEVQRAEDLLSQKESEREKMLQSYKSLSQDAVQLGEVNHSLEGEVVERKRNLCDTESKLTHVSRQLAKRERELNDANEEIGKLKESIDDLQRKTDRFAAERDKVKRELEAMRELCHKLEFEKEKLNAEVNEYVEIRRELELENEKLRNELVQNEMRDEWNKIHTTSV